MKRRRDGQAHGFEAAGAQELFGAFDLGGRTRQNILGRGVAVGDDEVKLLFINYFFDFLIRSDDGQHRALVGAVSFHQAAAKAGQGVKRPLVITSGEMERHQFTVGMPGGRVGLHAEAFERAPSGQGSRAQGGLGDIGGPKLLVLSFLLLRGPCGTREHVVA